MNNNGELENSFDQQESDLSLSSMCPIQENAKSSNSDKSLTASLHSLLASRSEVAKLTPRDSPTNSSNEQFTPSTGQRCEEVATIVAETDIDMDVACILDGTCNQQQHKQLHGDIFLNNIDVQTDVHSEVNSKPTKEAALIVGHASDSLTCVELKNNITQPSLVSLNTLQNNTSDNLHSACPVQSPCPTDSVPTTSHGSTVVITAGEKNMKEDQAHVRNDDNNIDTAQHASRSQAFLISCDICEKPCQRAVSLHCCQIQGCRACAVKYLTRKRQCWGCGTGASTTDIEIDLMLREAVKTVQSKGSLSQKVFVELELRNAVRMKIVESRKIFGLASVVETDKVTSVIDLSEDKKFNVEKAEMEDIHDERWKVLKETRTDKERVQLAKKMFGNAVETDPNRNLSFHGYRARGYKRKHLQPCSFHIQSGRLRPLEGYKKIYKYEDSKLHAHHDGESLSNEEKIKIKDIPDVMKDVFLEQLQERYGKRYNNQDYNELTRFVKHYVNGFKETSDFFSFYNLGMSEKQISKERLEEMVDIERLVGTFCHYYGPTEKTFCRECDIEHRF